jgi:lipopolysaccharide biosynthesis regulator YciM
LKYALGLTSEAIAHRAYQRAVAHVGSPNSAEARQLERIRASIAIGHTRLAAGAYVAAVDKFKEAAARAACLDALLCINLEL